MKKLKAFTLIEVIVSIAIIGILAVGMLPVMSGGLMFLNRSKDITQNIFDAQQEMEFAIESIKANPDGMTHKTIKVFDGYDVEVTYYEVSKEKNGRKYTTLVSETRPLKYNMLSLTGAKAVANNNVNLKVVEGSSANKIEARHDAITDSEYFKTSYQWYKSRKGFNIPIPESGVSEVEIGTIYPVFPDDYEPLPLNFDTTLINDLTAFAGRHVIFTAEPVSIYGKFGQKSISNTIYVAETMFSDKLRLHLDASLIDESNSTQVRKSADDSYVLSWTNLSKTSNNAIEVNNNRQPLVVTNAPHTDFNGKYVAFRAESNNSSNNNKLTVSGYTEIFSGSYDMFVVINGDDDEVIKHGDLKVNVYDSPPNNSSNGTNKVNASITTVGNGWKIARVSNYTPTYKINSTYSFVIENVNVNIAEVLVYSNLNNDDETDVLNFLLEKYKIYGEAAEIDRLHDSRVEVFRDESYSLPPSVFATFIGGKSGYVPVVWNSSVNAPGGIVDTSQIRTLAFTGYASSDSTKTVSLEVDVKPVTQLTSLIINPIEQPLEVGEIANMTYNFSPTNATLINAEWKSSNPDVAVIDTATGELRAIKNGKTKVSISSNGITSGNYEVIVSLFPDISGLVLHLDGTISTSVELDSYNRVEKWMDMSGNGNDFVQSSDFNKPLIDVNGYIVFDGSNDRMEKIGNLSGVEFFTKSETDFTMFIVGSTEKASNNSWRFYFTQHDGNSTTFSLGRDSYANIELYASDDNNLILKRTDDEIKQYSIVNSKSNVNLRENSVLIGSIKGKKSNRDGNKVVLGAGQGGLGNFLKGKIGEIIVYNRSLGSQEITQIENYLKSKWID